jgi:hypothetical protein
VVQALLNANPSGVMDNDKYGHLPRHLASGKDKDKDKDKDKSRGKGPSLEVVQALVAAYPQATGVRDFERNLPVHVPVTSPVPSPAPAPTHAPVPSGQSKSAQLKAKEEEEMLKKYFPSQAVPLPPRPPCYTEELQNWQWG